MFRHVVLFRWKPEADQEQKQAVAEELRKLPSEISELRGYHVGPDAGMRAGNYDFAVVADFDDPGGYIAYRDHPAHRAVVDKHITPIVSERAAVQYEN
jgi:stress responsive alpha/beta barrel protein